MPIQNLIRKNVILAPYSSFQIGGPADLFAEPDSVEDFIELIQYALKSKIPFFILGGGSNTLFHDNGFRGFVIRPVFKKIVVVLDAGDSPEVFAESGALLSRVIQKALEKNLGGMELLIGLPGTVGGAIRGNAGAEGLEIKDVLKNADVYDVEKNARIKIPVENLDFSYRHSIFKELSHTKNLFILGGTFRFNRINTIAPLRQKMAEILRKRTLTQPKGKSAGCVFKNPAKGISSGRLIDECGLKGMRMGDIEISMTHGNFFINHGKGTQKDVIELIKVAQEKIKKEKGYDLKIEIEIINESMLK